MKRLTAEFEIALSEYLAVKCAKDDPPCFNAVVNGFDVAVQIKPNFVSGSKRGRERHFKLAFNELTLKATRDETESPTPIVASESGEKDYTIQTDYFQQRIADYSDAASETLQRFLNFFRYCLKQPISNDARSYSHSIGNPKWLDENGDLAGKGMMGWMVPSIPGVASNHFGVRVYQKKDKTRLERSLRKPVVPTLAEEFLADAQTAAFNGNLRRAVVEMAISCEVAVKHRFFGRSSTASLAFEVLEDRGNIKCRVVDLVHTIALQVFGESFCKRFPDDYDRIDYLYRCRNKIAHRGVTSFRDKHGGEVNLTDGMIHDWWVAVESLMEWLKNLKAP